MNSRLKWMLGETLGTFILVFVGCGTVATAVALNAQMGIFQVAAVWGFGVALAIILTAQLSHAHLNPAVTIAVATFGGFPWKRVPGYILCQFVGAFAAAGLVLAVYGGAIDLYETENQIVRGASGSEASAMIFGEFFPNPEGKPIPAERQQHIAVRHAFLAEFVGTAILLLAIFGLTHPHNTSYPNKISALMIGMVIMILISLFAPISQGGFNPARDLAPRLFSSLAGWKDIPFSVNGFGWCTVYVVAPILGGLAGGGIAKYTLFRGYKD